MIPRAIQLNVVSEPETDIELPENHSKRKASEMDFEVPPAKRTEPADDSATESESDSDVIPRSSLPLDSATSKGTVAAHYHANLFSPRLILGGLKSSLVDDSVTESESDDDLLDHAVRVYRMRLRIHTHAATICPAAT